MKLSSIIVESEYLTDLCKVSLVVGTIHLEFHDAFNASPAPIVYKGQYIICACVCLTAITHEQYVTEILYLDHGYPKCGC